MNMYLLFFNIKRQINHYLKNNTLPIMKAEVNIKHCSAHCKKSSWIPSQE